MSEQVLEKKVVESIPQEPRVAQEARVPQPKRFHCPDCDSKYTVPEVESERPVEDESIKEKGLVEHGLECPNCGYWLHTYFSTIKQRKAQERVQQAKRDLRRHGNPHNYKAYSGAVKRHRKLFDATQKRVRKLVGVKAGPAEILKKIREYEALKRAAAKSETTAEGGMADEEE